MSTKKTATQLAPEAAPETGTVNYINTRAESAPFNLKVGDEIVKPVIQPNNSYVWPIPKQILNQALRHTHLVTGRLTAEK